MPTETGPKAQTGNGPNRKVTSAESETEPRSRPRNASHHPSGTTLAKVTTPARRPDGQQKEGQRRAGRQPTHENDRLCRGKPHGRRQGGKDLASEPSRCAALKNQRGARNVAGRKLNKPLPTGSKRTLGVERSQTGERKNVTRLWARRMGPPGKKAWSIHPSEGQKPQEGTSLDAEAAHTAKWTSTGTGEKRLATA